MLAALGSIVQDVYHFPFFDKWYNGEKVWGLHDAAIKSGALWQVRSVRSRLRVLCRSMPLFDIHGC